MDPTKNGTSTLICNIQKMDNKGAEIHELKNMSGTNTTIEIRQNENVNQDPNPDAPIIDNRYSRGLFKSPSKQTEVKEKYGKFAGLLHAITMEYVGNIHTISLF